MLTKLKPAQRAAILSHGPLVLKDVDAYSRLITAAVKNMATRVFPFLPK
ncbi:MAG TPA: hypothetical protein VMT12_11900 [Syntrophales bacterium]|nr:hypothetical protein [Syntrophales bacterium]